MEPSIAQCSATIGKYFCWLNSKSRFDQLLSTLQRKEIHVLRNVLVSLSTIIEMFITFAQEVPPKVTDQGHRKVREDHSRPKLWT